MSQTTIKTGLCLLGCIFLTTWPTLSFAQQHVDHQVPAHQQDTVRHQEPVQHQAIQHQEAAQHKDPGNRQQHVRRSDPNFTWAKTAFAMLDAMLADTDEVTVSSPVDDLVLEPQSVTPAVPVVVAPADNQLVDTVTVNIPNSVGGYNTLNLKRAGDGFIGPQGEFYSTFPTFQQLMLMYGK
jgi:hypothetical protein